MEQSCSQKRPILRKKTKPAVQTTPSEQKSSPSSLKDKVQEIPEEEKNTREEELKKEIKRRVKLEKEIYKRQEFMILHSVVPMQFLTQSASFFEPSHYLDVVVERSLAGYCGFPLCQNAVQFNNKTVEQKYKISLSKKKVYEVAEYQCYCSEKCIVASKLYSSQLDTTPVHLRTAPTNIVFDSQTLSDYPQQFTNEKLQVSTGFSEEADINIVEHPSESIATGSFPSRESNDLIEGACVPVTKPCDTSTGISATSVVNPEVTPTVKAKEGKVESDSIKEISFQEQSNDISDAIDSMLSFDIDIPPLSTFGVMYTSLSSLITHHTHTFLQLSKDQERMELIAVIDQLHTTVMSISNPSPSEMRRKAMLSMVSLYSRSVFSFFGIHCVGLEQEMTELIHTFSFKNPFDSFTVQQWKTIILVFVYALALKNDKLQVQLKNSENKLSSFLSRCGFGIDEFNAFTDCFKP